MAVRFYPDASGIQDLVQSLGARTFLEGLGTDVLQRVEAVSTFSRAPGYVESIRRTKATSTPTSTKVTVYSTDIAAHLIEWGSARNPAYAPLRRAVTGMGLRFDEQGR